MPMLTDMLMSLSDWSSSSRTLAAMRGPATVAPAFPLPFNSTMNSSPPMRTLMSPGSVSVRRISATSWRTALAKAAPSSWLIRVKLSMSSRRRAQRSPEGFPAIYSWAALVPASLFHSPVRESLDLASSRAIAMVCSLVMSSMMPSTVPFWPLSPYSTADMVTRHQEFLTVKNWAEAVRFPLWMSSYIRIKSLRPSGATISCAKLSGIFTYRPPHWYRALVRSGMMQSRRSG